jgi:hypothetical protein
MNALRISLFATLAALSLHAEPAVEAGDSVDFYQYEVQVYTNWGRIPTWQWLTIYTTDDRDDAALAYELTVAVADGDDRTYRELMLLNPDDYMVSSVVGHVLRADKILDIRVVKTPKYLNVYPNIKW